MYNNYTKYLEEEKKKAKAKTEKKLSLADRVSKLEGTGKKKNAKDKKKKPSPLIPKPFDCDD